MRFHPCLFSAFAFIAAACSTIPEETETLLYKPIDCSRADEDIAALTAEIPEGGDRRRAAIRSLTPVGIATGIVTRDYRDRARVATGRLEKDLNNKIADIYEECGQQAQQAARI